MPSACDGRKAAGEPRAGWPLGGIGGPIIGAVLRAEAPALLVGRGDRPGSGGGEACVQPGLHVRAVGGASICHGSDRTAQDCFRLQRHRAAPGAVAWRVGHVVGDEARVLRVARRVHGVADLGAASLPARHRPALWGRAGAVCLAALVARPAAPLELVPGDVALCGVDRFARAAVHGDERTRQEGQRLAEQRARTADLPEGLQGVLTDVRTRLVSRPQRLQQPQQFDMPGGSCARRRRARRREREPYM